MPKALAVDALIGRNVRMLRAYHDMGQAELAEKMSVQHPTWAQATVSQVERGQRAVLVSEAQSLAAALGVPLERLLAG